MPSTNIIEMMGELFDAGYFIGARNPERNSHFEGKFMVCEDVTAPGGPDASEGGFCVVGDDLEEIIAFAYEMLD